MEVGGLRQERILSAAASFELKTLADWISALPTHATDVAHLLRLDWASKIEELAM